MQLSGQWTDYWVAFSSGVLVSFTPCVYPIIPISASFIGGINTSGSRWMGFALSSIYVLGLAIMYSALAAIAVLSGKFFGQFQSNPWIFFIVANIVLVFALSMLDVISLPVLSLNLHHKIKSKNIFTVILFGMASGLVVGPCTAPVLGTLLVYVGSKQNLFHAISLLFVFAYGVGTSLILVGTFTGLLSNLPRSGKWLHLIKKFCGIVLIFIAEYFLIQSGGLF